jgi:hypothetical protein
VQVASRVLPAWQPDHGTGEPLLTWNAAPVDSATGRSWSACCSVASTTVDPESSSMYASCLRGTNRPSDPAILPEQLMRSALACLEAATAEVVVDIDACVCRLRCADVGHRLRQAAKAQAWHCAIKLHQINAAQCILQMLGATVHVAHSSATQCRRSLWRVAEAERHRHPAGQPGAPCACHVLRPCSGRCQCV